MTSQKDDTTLTNIQRASSRCKYSIWIFIDSNTSVTLRNSVLFPTKQLPVPNLDSFSLQEVESWRICSAELISCSKHAGWHWQWRNPLYTHSRPWLNWCHQYRWQSRLCYFHIRQSTFFDRKCRSSSLASFVFFELRRLVRRSLPSIHTLASLNRSSDFCPCKPAGADVFHLHSVTSARCQFSFLKWHNKGQIWEQICRTREACVLFCHVTIFNPMMAFNCSSCYESCYRREPS